MAGPGPEKSLISRPWREAAASTHHRRRTPRPLLRQRRTSRPGAVPTHPCARPRFPLAQGRSGWDSPGKARAQARGRALAAENGHHWAESCCEHRLAEPAPGQANPLGEGSSADAQLTGAGSKREVTRIRAWRVPAAEKLRLAGGRTLTGRGGGLAPSRRLVSAAGQDEKTRSWGRCSQS